MNLHRNNAAEWVMWAVLLPLVPIVWLIERLARKGRMEPQINADERR